MKYIIMCGGTYPKWKTPRWFVKVNGERIIDRTIRLLKENGVMDIAISSNYDIFDYIDIPILQHENNYVYYDNKTDGSGQWIDAFYPTDEEACYIFGDVIFSPNAIKKIVETQTNDIEFFASAPPFAYNYPKPWAEPFAFKVVNQKHFKEAIEEAKQLQREGKLKRLISWELWQVIKHTQLRVIDYKNYTVINDYTCDIDSEGDVAYWKKIYQ